MKLKPYCFLAEYLCYRGAHAAFSLRDLVAGARELGPPSSVGVSVIFQDAREEFIIDTKRLSSPANVSRETARFQMLDFSRKAAAPGAIFHGPGPTKEQLAKWRRWLDSGPTDAEIDGWINAAEREWITDDAVLDALEVEIAEADK